MDRGRPLPLFWLEARVTYGELLCPMTQEHMVQRVKRDARLDPLGARVREDPKQTIADTISATLEALAKQGLLGASRPAP